MPMQPDWPVKHPTDERSVLKNGAFGYWKELASDDRDSNHDFDPKNARHVFPMMTFCLH